jgi:hypothetical protein
MIATESNSFITIPSAAFGNIGSSLLFVVGAEFGGWRRLMMFGDANARFGSRILERRRNQCCY